MNEFEVRATLHKSTDPAQPHGMVLSASTTIWLPIPPQTVFDFFRDGRTRPQVLSLQQISHMYTVLKYFQTLNGKFVKTSEELGVMK